ncbi:putative fad dependent oxidoreductase [Diplodia seriata]|uniref:Putative fad dependent oxidoreductase n=1 Tax=Diplodia seriata TaxID=420778 RepID=A0A0G2DU62_9PEZI|nr:putative fad dependent oxidoreductase [Diplodia seriata]
MQIRAHISPTSASLPPTATTVVIGSGITACSLVNALLQKDLDADIVVCEARGLTSGATGRNGGHLVSSAVADFSALQADFGTAMAVKVAAFTLANVERMFEVVASGELGPGVGEASELRRVDKVLALRDDGAVGKLEASLEAFEANMPERWKGQMRMVGKGELEEKYKLRNVAGGAIGKGGALWPYRLITRAWAHLLSQHPNRLRIETWTPVTSVATSPSADATQQHPYLLTTPRGPIAATEVVYCTNGHTGHLLPRLRQRPGPGGGGAALFPLRGTMTVQDCGPSFPDEGARRTLSFYGSVKVVLPPPPTPNKNSSSNNDPVFDLGLHYMQQNAATGAVFIGGESATAADMLNADDSRASATSLARLEGVLRAEFKDEVWSEKKEEEEEDEVDVP